MSAGFTTFTPQSLKEHDEQVRIEERIKVIVELLDMSHGVWNLPDMQDRLRAMRDSLRKGAP